MKNGTLTWEDLLSRWHLIVPDMQSEYGIDVSGRTALRAIPWRRGKLLLIGLVTADTRLSRELARDSGNRRSQSGR